MKKIIILIAFALLNCSSIIAPVYSAYYDEAGRYILTPEERKQIREKEKQQEAESKKLIHAYFAIGIVGVIGFFSLVCFAQYKYIEKMYPEIPEGSRLSFAIGSTAIAMAGGAALGRALASKGRKA